ncbi:hypothetical protein [Parafannyhessea umbonata]|jgi:hypothetical protein|uniref:Uncharacterized protein n=3 Tax=Parafannyhessea umbonata TaxID=604330 RepID=A0A1G6LU38_9ACTN|nr:hypothetical protein [Parafannyhessea umbonata]MCI7218383.1 hypothetical protein [Parafannyhessea umbonata]MDD6566843.1 hypothetical protein [Parafannyhessea umbonata]MDD6601255.1 hypothetical protein [Parafannyhessea umbonata]MST61226.1 hypothetical protein [Parafannyhessea umbonata]SDC46760.1 hypothetical protein SAMN04487824_11644 [Parafannyhessea umbonata]
MSKRLKITIDGQTLYADLCEAEAPGAVAALEQAGGFESVLFAADVCYGELTFATPASDYWDEQNVQEETLPGDVTLYNDWSAVCIFTQRMEQFAPGAKVAQIRSADLPAFQELYARVWSHQGVRLRCEVVECDEAGTERHLGPTSTPRHMAPPAVARFEALLREIWLERPVELDDMVERNATTGRELGVWAYAWGELVNLSDMLLVLMRMARQKNGGVRTLRAVAAEQCRFFSEVFGSSAHMVDTRLILAEAASYLEGTETYEAFVELARAVQLWVLQMSFWCDMELPWDVMSRTLHEAWNPDVPTAGASASEPGRGGKHKKDAKPKKKRKKCKGEKDKGAEKGKKSKKKAEKGRKAKQGGAEASE